jgi:hypothetical protein
VTSLASPPDHCSHVLDEQDFRCLLAKEASRASRYQDFFSVCLVRPDVSPGAEEMRQAVAAKVSELLRRSDVVGRLEGETAVLLLHTTEAEARRVAERIRSTIGRVAFPAAGGQGVQRITVSVGEASFPDDSASYRALLSAARTHLEEATRRGGNQVVHRA